MVFGNGVIDSQFAEEVWSAVNGAESHGMGELTVCLHILQKKYGAKQDGVVPHIDRLLGSNRLQ